MKRLLPLLILTLLFINCKKEAEHCWKCDFKYTAGQLPERTGDTVLCNFTQTDIDLREGLTFDTPGDDYTFWTITNCKQQ